MSTASDLLTAYIATLRSDYEVLGADPAVIETRLREFGQVVEMVRAETSGPSVSGDVALLALSAADTIANSVGSPAEVSERLIEELTKRGVVVLGKGDHDELTTQRRDFAKIVAALGDYVTLNSLDHDDDDCPMDDTCECPVFWAISKTFTTELLRAARKLEGK